MERIWPRQAPEDLGEVYGDLAPPDDWLAIGMVSSADGATTVDGVSGALGDAGDLAGFRGLRALADVILVGAGTVRAERYGPPRVAAAHAPRRRERGQAARPELAIVTGSLDLGDADRLFDEEPDFRPIVLTSAEADPGRRRALEQRGALVLVAGREDVDVRDAVDVLRARGLRRIVCEGGPRLNGQVVAAGLADELFLTIAPVLVVGSSRRIAEGTASVSAPLELLEARHHASELLLRYRVLHGR